MSEIVNQNDTPPDGWTMEQVQAAREAGPHMLEILAGWIMAEQTLGGGAGVSFRHKLKASNDLRGLFATAEATVARILSADDAIQQSRPSQTSV